jgi:(S)-ureidoglycine aminohydrolase
MSDPYGFTRSVTKRNYALLTPAGLVAGTLPGWRDAQTTVVIAPRMGAQFTQLLVALDAAGEGRFPPDERERLVFVLEGSARAESGMEGTRLGAGGYAYLPAHAPARIAAEGEAKLLVFEKPYTPLAGVEPPAAVFGDEAQIAGGPFLGDEAAILKLLLPDTPAFDLAVNIFTFQPGATLPFVETHVMEHGMMMIQGSGIYRLDNDWHPVREGDTIWMAPFCPQWFVATGKTPARYIYYKDINREPRSKAEAFAPQIS